MYLPRYKNESFYLEVSLCATAFTGWGANMSILGHTHFLKLQKTCSLESMGTLSNSSL